MHSYSLVKIFLLLTVVLTPTIVLAETPINALSVSVSPKPLTLKPNATEGYAQKMRQFKLITIEISQELQISPPINSFREMEMIAKPLSELFSERIQIFPSSVVINLIP
jgi:hypothetical protein